MLLRGKCSLSAHTGPQRPNPLHLVWSPPPSFSRMVGWWWDNGLNIHAHPSLFDITYQTIEWSSSVTHRDLQIKRIVKFTQAHDGLVSTSSAKHHQGICNKGFTFSDTHMNFVVYAKVPFRFVYHAETSMPSKQNRPSINMVHNDLDPNNIWGVHKPTSNLGIPAK